MFASPCICALLFASCPVSIALNYLRETKCALYCGLSPPGTLSLSCGHFDVSPQQMSLSCVWFFPIIFLWGCFSLHCTAETTGLSCFFWDAVSLLNFIMECLFKNYLDHTWAPCQSMRPHFTPFAGTQSSRKIRYRIPTCRTDLSPGHPAWGPSHQYSLCRNKESRTTGDQILPLFFSPTGAITAIQKWRCLVGWREFGIPIIPARTSWRIAPVLYRM